MSLNGKINRAVVLGVFGGTFNPPHIGHLILADEARHQLGLEKVLWVLTPFPPHKDDRDILSLSARLAMLQAMLAEDPHFEVSNVDLDRSPPHYAVDTMQILRQQYPDVYLVYLMGADSLLDLPSWRRSQSFVDSCDAIGVMCRPGRQVDMVLLEDKLLGIQKKVRYIQAPLLEISSSQLRARVKNGQPFRYFILSQVYDLIIKGRYYQKES
jgi:nicotinate-nucleotide adenylyltransferase